MITAIFARAGTAHVPLQGESKLARWQVPTEDHEEAFAIVRENGIKGPIFALIERGPQIIVPTDPKESA